MAAFGWVIATFLYIFFDVAYFLRGLLIFAFCKIKPLVKWKHGGDSNKTFIKSTKFFGICLSSDLDFWWHMNNARYLRDCDFARVELWLTTGIWDVVARLGGGIVLAGSTIRYRRPLHIFDTFIIQSTILCWDEKAFYIEQRFIRRHDKFVCAIVLAKQSLLKLSPGSVLKELTGQNMESPEFPEEVQAWIRYIETSSEMLKKSL